MGGKKAEIIEIVKDFKKRAKEKYGLQRIILFGSQATGRATPESDVDLLVVIGDFQNRASIMAKLLKEWHTIQKKDIPVDFIPFRAKEFKKLSKEISLVSLALKEGIEI